MTVLSDQKEAEETCFPSLLFLFLNVRQKTWKITAGLVPKQAEERCVPHQPFVRSYIRPAKEVISHSIDYLTRVIQPWVSSKSPSWIP